MPPPSVPSPPTPPTSPMPPIAGIPTPPSTVVVNFPPEVVDKLSPHTDGLSQPSATIIAACIAIAAAAVALGGVWWQIRAAAIQAEKNRKNDAALARQNQRIARVSEALSSLHDVQKMSYELYLARQASRDTTKLRSDYSALRLRCALFVNMLNVLGLPKSSEAVKNYLDSALQVADVATTNDEGVRLDARHSDLMRTFNEEMFTQ